jgi:hypothetical protein
MKISALRVLVLFGALFSAQSSVFACDEAALQGTWQHIEMSPENANSGSSTTFVFDKNVLTAKLEMIDSIGVYLDITTTLESSLDAESCTLTVTPGNTVTRTYRVFDEDVRDESERTYQSTAGTDRFHIAFSPNGQSFLLEQDGEDPISFVRK